MTLQQLSSDDVIAYLDIGDAYWRGDWHNAINAYWSPLYSWILGGAMTMLRPTIHWEFAVVKLVNFAIYIGAIATFDRFLREFIAFSESKTHDGFRVPRAAWLVLGCVMFLWTSLSWIGVSSDTPDMLVAALVYLAATLVLCIRAGGGLVSFAALGAVVAAAYLAKAAMFPIAFVFIAVASLVVRSRPGALISIASFAVVAAPFIIAISVAKGRPTFGEAGRLNYAWQVTRDVQPFRFWRGQSGPGGTPLHPPRTLAERPRTFEFAKPVGGTYPPWHDPSYWYEGVTTRFRPAGQLVALRSSTIYYVRLFGALFTVAWLAAAAAGGNLPSSLRAVTATWPVSVPALAAVGVYWIGADLRASDIPTQPSSRFIGAFATMLLLSLVAGLRSKNTQPGRRRLGVIAALFVAAVVGALVFDAAKRVERATDPEGRISNDQIRVAERLAALGVHRGDDVALVGSYIFPHQHWARLTRAHIVAEVFDGDLFWEQPPEARAGILERLRATGARAVLQRPWIRPPEDPGWRSIGGGYYVLMLGGPTGT